MGRFGFSSRSYVHAASGKLSVLFEPLSPLLGNSVKPITIRECKQIHAKLIVSQCVSEIHLTNTLLGLSFKCGAFDHAHQLFDQMPHKNVVTWTTLISAHVGTGSFRRALSMFNEMRAMGEKPNEHTFSTLLRACANPTLRNLGLQIHGMVIHFGLEGHKFAGSSLVNMYFNTGGMLNDACLAFNDLSERDRITWNVMISGFAQLGDFIEVQRLFSEMQEVDGLKPDDGTITSLLKCCSSLDEVKQIHGLAFKYGFEVDVLVGSVLVDLYAKCGDIISCRHIYDSMEEKDTFVWSSIISGYAKNNRGDEAVHFFIDMCRKGTKPNEHVLSSTIKACAEIKDLKTGTQVHTHMIKNGYQYECFVASVLLSLYANFGELEDVEKLFRRIDDRDIVAWNSMLLAYAQLEQGSTSCMQLFQELHRSTFLHIEGTTIVAVLKSCQSSSDLLAGRLIHSLILKSNASHHIVVANAVISMYSECGEIDDAYKAFVDIVGKDASSWSSIIGAYQQNGKELEALALCKMMLAVGISFTSYSLPLCIAACSQRSAVDAGKQFHGFVVKSGFTNDLYVGSSIIDMYAKCGNMQESEKVFDEQPKPNEVLYNAMICGYAHHGKAQKAMELFGKMEKVCLIPNRVTFLAVLSACSHVGYLDESLFFFTLMINQYKIKPESMHYSCLVDAYGRAGRFEEACQIVEKDGSEPAWRTLLSACNTYGDTEIAEKSATKLVELNPHDHASYVLLSNIYTREGKWEEALKWRAEMAKVCVKKDAGTSWLI
ncbi:pentatricopeptide repeat-containing protein At3g57430, chloroplastic-like [Neltuma alba]|uniref:pentatricopeptide repeat-containing protein At3g57430, chloroplastic-like n=1 Tax=Neltuma alba TaxID=207710 RepID=UPI0010A3992B|nr:pentatricopeptide repeat-containing protein At3g57430, chloroplastic-like [Prosopis alba]